MIINQLRERTQQSHKELDEWLMPKFSEISSADKYSELLKIFYGYFLPVTHLVDKHFETTALPDYSTRRKPAAILQDLTALKKSHDKVPYAKQLPNINNTSQAFGALYVLEGSTLGGVFLSKMLANQINIDECNGLSFFYGYGKQSSEKWKVFIEHLNAFGEKHNAEEITNAAVETFECFKIHLQQHI